MFAHRLDLQAEGGLFQNEPGDRHQSKGDIYQNVVVKQHRSHIGDLGQTEEVQRLEGYDFGRQRADTENQPVDVGRQTRGQNVHADTGDHLIDTQRNAEPGHQYAVQRAGQYAYGKAEPQTAGGCRNGEAADGGHQHGTLDTQVKDAGALGIDLAQSGHQNGGCKADGTRQKTDEKSQGKDFTPHVLSPFLRITCRTRCSGAP